LPKGNLEAVTNVASDDPDLAPPMPFKWTRRHLRLLESDVDTQNQVTSAANTTILPSFVWNSDTRMQPERAVDTHQEQKQNSFSQNARCNSTLASQQLWPLFQRLVIGFPCFWAWRHSLGDATSTFWCSWTPLNSWLPDGMLVRIACSLQSTIATKSLGKQDTFHQK
jgi:hypothetical protein